MEPPFEEFVAARGGALLRFALMVTGDPHRAEDLVQSVLARAYVRWARVAAMARPEAYLKKMLVNEHLRWWRRLSSSEVPVGGLADETSVGDGAGSFAARDATWELLRRLPRRQRAVLVLRYYEDLSDAEIAEVLGCAPGTVRSQAARALAALRLAVPTIDRAGNRIARVVGRTVRAGRPDIDLGLLLLRDGRPAGRLGEPGG